MATQKVKVVAASGLDSEYTPLLVSAGAGSSGNIPALDGTGRLDSTFMPVGIGADTAAIVASETLTAGQWVNIWNNTGVKNVRKADSTDATKPCHGFVIAGYASSATATVYFAGLNTQIPIGSFTITDLGAPVFLSTSGATTKTPPATTGNWLQQVGWVDDVGATLVTVNFDQIQGTVRG